MLQIKSFAFNPFAENTYIVFVDDKSAFLIDPGNVHDHETTELQKFISDNGLKIKNILLTHAHIDHVLGLQWAFDTFKVPVLMHEEDKEVLDRNPMTARNYGFFFKPFEGDIEFVKENDVLDLSGNSFKIYHVPGHSPGSVVYHNEAESFIISGDVLFQGSIGRTDLYKGDSELLLNSIRSKLFKMPGETKVFPGHGGSTTIGFERDFNPFFK